MIVANLDLGPWRPGEDTRVEPSPSHADAVTRMDFERAVDHAEACGSCRVQFRRD